MRDSRPTILPFLAVWPLVAVEDQDRKAFASPPMGFARPLDNQLRRHVYDVTIVDGVPPTAEKAAADLGLSPDQVRAAFERLAAEHVLVLQRDTREILMAMPFSAVETPFPTRVGPRCYYANCAFDALGIAAMLREDARIDGCCGCCSSALALKVASGNLEPASGVVHFAVPARRFWDNIVFT